MPIENFDSYEMIDVPKQFHNKADYVLRVDGDSMTDDGILNGDYVILKKYFLKDGRGSPHFSDQRNWLFSPH